MYLFNYVKTLLFLVVFYLFSSLSLVAENNSVLDSLKQELKQKRQEDTLKVDLLIEISNQLKGDDKQKEKYLLEAISMAKNLDNNKYLVIPLLNITRYYLNNGEFDLAYEKALYSIDVGKKMNASTFVVEGFNNLALIYTKQNKNEEALSVYKEAYEYVKKEPASMDKAILSFNIGFTYFQQKQYKEAEKWYKEVESICEEIQLDFGILRSYGALLSLYGKTKQFELGDQYETKTLKLINEIKNIRSKAAVYTNLTIYSSDKSDYKKTIEYGKLAEQIYLELNMKSELISIDDKIFNAYKKESDYKEALIYAEKKMVLVDSIYSEKQMEKIEELETKYETDKLKQEKAFETIRAEKNKKLFITSLIIGVLVLLVALFVIYQVQLKKRAEFAELKLSETENILILERKYRKAELKALKSQMNPHFLFNAFNSIQEFIILNKKEVASEYLGKFSDLMRLYLEQSRNSEIQLEEELRSLGLYLELEKVRFGDSLNFEINVEKGIDKFSTNVPPLIIQPFVENSLKHGLLHKKTDRKLWVEFKKDNNKLICKIRDNGIGRRQSALLNKNRIKTHKSFAISSIESRIELLNVNREKDITLAINDLYDKENIALGTEVVLSIPL